jgi:fatty-acyl-CoA synthase
LNHFPVGQRGRPKWIEAVAAVIVRRPGSQLDEARVIAAAGARLAHFKVPKRVHFVDALPKNPSGKLLKRELRRLYDN